LRRLEFVLRLAGLGIEELKRRIRNGVFLGFRRSRTTEDRTQAGCI
jgi:hypothetical protein